MPRQPIQRTPHLRSIRADSPAAQSRRLAEDRVLESPFITRPAGLEPFQAKLPPARELNALDDAGLARLLLRFNIIGPWEEQRIDAAAYLQRMTSYPLGSPQYQAEMDRLTDQDSRAWLLKTARRAYQDFNLAYTDTGGKLIRICEDDETSCDTCVRLGGEVGTIEQHQALGLPGAHSCEGGDYCRCQLVPVS